MVKSKVMWTVIGALLCLGGGTIIMACGDDKPATPTAPAKVDGTAVRQGTEGRRRGTGKSEGTRWP